MDSKKRNAPHAGLRPTEQQALFLSHGGERLSADSACPGVPGGVEAT
jgi:hypothetical protein